MSQFEHVTVGIVGAGISGLTLAKMLELLGISYVLWEARSAIDEAAGAGVGLMPNGLRILDQLGLFEDIDKHHSPHHSWEYRDSNGTVYQTLTAMKALKTELGYGITFLERHELLDILYKNIEDKTRISFSRKVSDVSTFDNLATMTAADGSQVKCDFIAGADGVRSVVRDAIVRETLDYQVPQSYLDSNYACIYGLSYALPEIAPGRAIAIYREKISILVFSGCEGRLVWFLFVDLEDPIPLAQGKSYTIKDLEAIYKEISDVDITTGVKFADIYNNKKAAVMAPLEEGIADVWYAGRLFLLGDAAHKMVPHNAMGASQAMESAACFVNQLMEFRNKLEPSSPPEARIALVDVNVCLASYTRRRKIRAMSALNSANMACQFLLKIGPASKTHLDNLVKMTNEDFIAPKLLDFSSAEKLENWPWDSERVKCYTRQARNFSRGTSVASKL